MHPLHDYLAGQLEAQLKKERVVVFYDPRGEFRSFFDRELVGGAEDAGLLTTMTVGSTAARLARYRGSFFELREAVEPVVTADEPEPVLLYLPGVARDVHGSVLMELEKAGRPYEPEVKRLARNVLRQRFTDGQIDDMLRPASVGYDEIGA
jgi:hypothetical protein